MKWISVTERMPEEGHYYLVCSDQGWMGLRQFENNSWCRTQFPEVICDGVVYDVHDSSIKYYIAVQDIPWPDECCIEKDKE